jgi:hypothetical protein
VVVFLDAVVPPFWCLFERTEFEERPVLKCISKDLNIATAGMYGRGGNGGRIEL